MRFHRVTTGHYRAVGASGAVYEVERDVEEYVTIEQRDGDGELAGCDNDGWSLTIGDDAYDWYDTKRDAVAAANRLEEQWAKREAERQHFAQFVQFGNPGEDN
jgi:hypothetical protein